MYIKQIEIDNFKSFATKIEIPLLKGFSTIVGPNGSGKSNIIDAVLFALGLATSRNLRAEKIADFISTYTKRNEAIVKVHFLPHDKFLKLCNKSKPLLSLNVTFLHEVM